MQSDPQAALEELQQAKNATDPRAILGRGLALEQLRRYEEAAQVLQQACAARSAPVCWLALARVDTARGRLDDGRKAIDRALARDQRDLGAVLLEAFLANDDARAKTALVHLDRWRQTTGKGQGSAVPAEYALTQMVLFRQLKMKPEFEAARKAAANARLSQPRGALGLVELAVASERRELAVELLRKIAEQESSSEVRRQVAKLAHGLGDRRLVGHLLETLLGSDTELLVLRAEHDFFTGQPRATTSLQKALSQTKPGATRVRLQRFLVEALLAHGQTAEARKEAEKLQEETPGASAAWLLARVALAQGEPEEALAHLAPLLSAEDAPVETRELAARCHLVLGHRDLARKLLDDVLSKQPSHPTAPRLRVALELDAGNPEEAARVAASLVSRDPESVGLKLLFAEALREAKGPGAAAESLRQSTLAAPTDVRLRMALVRALEDSGGDALAALEEAHERFPEEPVFLAALASKLTETGNAQRAATLYERLIAGAKGDPVALNNLAMIYADELNDPSRSVELAERAHRLSQAPPIVDTLGWALYRRGSVEDLARARRLLESVRDALTSPTSQVHLGAVLLRTGSETEGKRLLNQALARSEDFGEAELARTLLQDALAHERDK